jgi:hypothetical protein
MVIGTDRGLRIGGCSDPRRHLRDTPLEPILRLGAQLPLDGQVETGTQQRQHDERGSGAPRDQLPAGAA